MVCVIEGNTMLQYKIVLKEFACISGRFLRAEEFFPQEVFDRAVAKSAAIILAQEEALISRMSAADTPYVGLRMGDTLKPGSHVDLDCRVVVSG